MRIIYLHQYFNTPDMPGGTRSYEMGRHLVAAGHEVHMVTSRCDGDGPTNDGWYETEEAGIHVHWLVNRYSNRMGFQRRLRAFFRYAWSSMFKAASLGGDVVFASSTPLTIAIPALYAARRNHIPMLFEVRDLWPYGPIAAGALKDPLSIAAARWLERRAYFGAARVVALSPWMKEGVVATGYPATQVTVIPNGSDVAEFRVPDEVGKEFLGRHPHLAAGPLVSYVGALGMMNGVHYLAEIAAAMLTLDPAVRFLVVGEGKYKEQVRCRAAELGVVNRNFWMLPAVPKREVPAILSASAVSASLVIDLPHRQHNSANKMFDTFAAGKPLLLNHGGWIAELLQQTGAGLVVPTRDATASARLLHEFLRDAGRMRNAQQASAELASTRFDREKLARQLLEILESVATHQQGYGCHV